MKREALGDAASAIPKRTTVGHCVQFISDMLNIMDEFPNMKGSHIVMDNFTSHKYKNFFFKNGRKYCIEF